MLKVLTYLKKSNKPNFSLQIEAYLANQTLNNKYLF